MVRHSVLQALSLVIVLLSACSFARPAPGLFSIGTPTTGTASSPGVMPTETSTTTVAPTSTQIPTQTPLPLPGTYQTALLNPLDTPHTYIQGPCKYLYDKWSSTNSTPGTVVMVIMFHDITNDALTNPSQISEFDFRHLMTSLHENGFQAITSLQLADFLEHNAKIPEHSVLLVADDRHTRQYFDVLFRPYWEKWGWPVVNAWISTDQTTAELWKQQQELNAEGWVDYQAHGFIHNIPIGPDSTDEFIQGELQKPIEIFQEFFNKKPIAFIWPGGGFTAHAAGMARQLGYRLGFTINPRGPLMYNWVPLADERDLQRPTWIREGPVQDPLMVLPRYWDTDAALHLKDVIQIGLEAAAYAHANQASEMAYYAGTCFPTFGSIP